MEDASEIVNTYFNKYNTGSAKEIYNKTGRRASYSAICEVLENLVKNGKLEMRVAASTKHVRAHYEFTLCNKKEPFIKRLFSKLFTLFK